jgi:hypothetical protein
MQQSSTGHAMVAGNVMAQAYVTLRENNQKPMQHMLPSPLEAATCQHIAAIPVQATS